MHPLSPEELLARRRVLKKETLHLAHLFKILCDANRYRIFFLLAHETPLSLGDVARILQISNPLTSQHVKILVHARLVRKHRVGKHVYLCLDRRGQGVSSLLRAVHPSLKPVSPQKPL